MAYGFTAASTAKYQAAKNGTSDMLSFVGCSAQSSITPAHAQTQINKLVAIVGEQVSQEQMKRTITEVSEDGERRE